MVKAKGKEQKAKGKSRKMKASPHFYKKEKRRPSVATVCLLPFAF
jgi:hypothetical protein